MSFMAIPVRMCRNFLRHSGHRANGSAPGTAAGKPRIQRLWARANHRSAAPSVTGPDHGAQRSPVPPQRWHLTTLSPFFSRPLPSQFLHFCFFLMLGPLSLAMTVSPVDSRARAMIQAHIFVYKHALTDGEEFR